MNQRLIKVTAFLAAAMITAAVPLTVQKNAWDGSTITAYADGEEEFTEGSSGSLQYFKYSDRIEIAGIDMSETTITIPSEIEGLPVTRIADNVGTFCAVETLKLPDSLKQIGAYAFSWCSNLKSVTLPDSLERIDFQAFEQCSALESVTFPPHFVETSSYTFAETPWLEAQRKNDPLVIVNGCVVDARTCKGDVTLPAGTKFIAGSAFANNTAVTSVTCPASVTGMGDNVFTGCENLTAADLKGVTYIGYETFYNCNKVKDIRLSGKLTEINTLAFEENTATATITFYGTEDAWNQVEKDPDDQFIKRATIIFDPNGGGSDDPVPGDINADGQCNHEDAVLLFDWLLAKPDVTLANWEAGDIDGSGTLNAVDLSLLKQMLLA